MKRTITVLMVLAVGAAMAMANGQAEGPGAGSDEPGRRYTADSESAELTGTIVEQDGHYLLATGDGTYSLSAPGSYRMGIDVEEGQELTVRGEIVEALEDCDCGADSHIFVSEADIDGETLEVVNPGRGPNGTADAPGARLGFTQDADDDTPYPGGRFGATADEDDFGTKGRTNGRGGAVDNSPRGRGGSPAGRGSYGPVVDDDDRQFEQVRRGRRG